MSSRMSRRWSMDAVNRSEVAAVHDELSRLASRLGRVGSQGSLGGDEVGEIRENMKRLSSRLAGVTGESSTVVPRVDGSVIDTAARTEITDESDEQRHIPPLTNENTIAGVRLCTFAEFKNRFSEKDGQHAVDALVSGFLLEGEYKEEKIFREKYERNEHEKHHSKRSKAKTETLARRMNQSANRSLRESQSSDIWVRRIRIQSPALLKIMARIQGEMWSATPRTYHRPFSSLAYFHPRVKEQLKRLEDRWGATLDGKGSTSNGRASPATTEATDSSTDNPDARPPPQENIEWCPKTLEVLRAYVKWFDAEIMVKEVTQFDKLDWKTAEKTTVWFYDLAFLFWVGDIVNRPLEGDSSSGKRNLRAGKRLWRVFAVKPCDTQVQHTHIDHRKYSSAQGHEERDDALNFVVKAYYIDWTGEEFCVVPKTFVIPPYQGGRAITSLPIFPMRFASNFEEVQDVALDIGQRVLKFLGDEHRHGSYNGWTITRTPAGDPMPDSRGEPMKQAEHVNSEVMIDFAETFQACPNWKPKRTVLRPEVLDQEIVPDDFPIMWWSDVNRTKLRGETTELVPTRTGVSVWSQNEYITERDKLLIKIAKNDDDGHLTTAKQLAREDHILITERVFGYIFQERKFAPLDVQKLQFSTAASDVYIAPMDTDALRSLKIEDKTKAAIQNSVRGHLLQRAVERQTGEERRSLDLIQGKGGGLFILLHGVPGVGKTATAEAIAQANSKPLFKITCGDLGLTPQEVEASLKGIFRLAALWDCILLLDEVDTFFSQRSKGDTAMAKNALVSVFLRVLDYYHGILFLTTNRAGSLDEAFKSRIHLKIYYHHLSRRQTLDIWANNITRLRRIEEEQGQHGLSRVTLQINDDTILDFADRLFDANKMMDIRWNGRQIRNAFQIARSLAYTEAWDAAEQEARVTGNRAVVRVLVIEKRHFQLVASISKSFDKYMSSVYSGANDSTLAKEREERDDKHRASDEEELDHPTYRSSVASVPYSPPHAQMAGFGGGYTTNSGGPARSFNTAARSAPPPSPGLSAQNLNIFPRQHPQQQTLTADFEDPVDNSRMAVPQAQQRAPSPGGMAPNPNNFLLAQPAARLQYPYAAPGSLPRTVPGDLEEYIGLTSATGRARHGSMGQGVRVQVAGGEQEGGRFEGVFEEGGGYYSRGSRP